MHEASAVPTSLGTISMAILIAWGALLWASGVLILRWVVSIDALQGSAHVLVYALTLAGTVPLVPLTPRLAGLPRSETVSAIAVASMTALLIDGIVIGYIPWLYSADPVQARGCASALLWAVGVALALAFIMQPRKG